MTRMISAIYENGAFRPTEPIEGMPDHMPVRLTFEDGSNLPLGVSGRALLDLIDSIGFDKDSAGEIAEAIEKDCERIDGEW